MLLLKRFYDGNVPRLPHLFIEGLMVSVLGAAFARWLFPVEASLVLVFLVSISTDHSLDALLTWNRVQIQVRRVRPLRANSALALRMLGVFAGATVGFSILGLVLPLGEVELLFSQQIAEYADRSFTELDFGGVGPLMVLNLYVFVFFFIIAIPFHHGGLMLAMAWNASVWGATFGVLARRWSEDSGDSLAGCYLRVMGACTPHMALEATAYVLAGLAGVFLGKGIMRHGAASEMMASITRSVLSLLGIGAGLLAVAAVWESLIGPVLVRLVTGG